MKDLHEANLFDSLRERLGRYEEAPSEELWGKIAAAQKKKRKAVWPVLVGMVSIIGIGAAVFFSLDDVEVKEVISESRKTEISEHPVSKPAIALIEENSQEPVSASTITNYESPITNHEPPITSHESPITKHTSQITQDSTIIETHDPLTDNPQPRTESQPTTEVVPPFKKPKSKFQFYASVTP